MTNETVKYLITLKVEQVGKLRQAMESAGIQFDAEDNMIGMPTDNIEEKSWMGKDAAFLREKVNEYLEEQEKTERITQLFTEMDIRAQRDLLLLGSIHSDWQKEFIKEISPGNGRNSDRGTQRPYCPIIPENRCRPGSRASRPSPRLEAALTEVLSLWEMPANCPAGRQ